MLYSAATINAPQTTLSAAITASAVTISLASVIGLQTSGILVLDRIDSSNNETPTLREYLSYTSRSTNVFSGITRGISNSSPLAHGSGSVVEAVSSVLHWNSLVSHLRLEHDSIGIHNLNTATINYTETKNLVVTSIASMAGMILSSSTITNLSTVTMIYPWTGQFIWSWQGSLTTMLTSLASYQLPMARTSRNYTIKDVYVGLLSAPSTGVATFDISYRSHPTVALTSIFSTKPTIDVGEYETTTAATPYVLSLTSLASGIYLSSEVETHGGAGDMAMSLIVQERT